MAKKQTPQVRHYIRYRFTCEHCGQESGWIDASLLGESEQDILTKKLPAGRDGAMKGNFFDLTGVEGKCKNCKRRQSWELAEAKTWMKRSPLIGAGLAGMGGFALAFLFGLAGFLVVFAAGMVIAMICGLVMYIRVKRDVARTTNRFAPEFDWMAKGFENTSAAPPRAIGKGGKGQASEQGSGGIAALPVAAGRLDGAKPPGTVSGEEATTPHAAKPEPVMAGGETPLFAAGAADEQQFMGRRRVPDEREAQAMGRNAVSAARPAASDTAGATPNAARMAPHEAGRMAGFPSAMVRDAAPPAPKRRHSKGRIAAYCAVSALAVVLFAAGIFAAVSVWGKRAGGTSGTGQSVSSAVGSASSASSAESSSGAAEIPEAQAVSLKDGEYLYTGYLDCPQAGLFEVSFILSADRSTIHDLTVRITDLEASVQRGNQTTTVNISNLTETLAGDHDIDFENGSYNIPVGRSIIRDLYFYDNVAYMFLEYVYYSTSPGSGGSVEIPLETASGELLTETAPVLADAEDDAVNEPIEAPSTQTVFSYDLLRNWSGELDGGVYSFVPENPMPRNYIVCVNTVIDPETGGESQGGYEISYTRHKPVSTDDVLRRSGELIDGGLILTDDPDQATYVLIITFAYDHTGNFRFNDGTNVTQYHGTTTAELYNLTTGESIHTGEMITYATYANESVYTVMLENAKGKQLYARSHTVKASDFSEYADFIEGR